MYRIVPILLLLLSAVSCKSGETPHSQQHQSPITMLAGIEMTVPYKIQVGRPLSLEARQQLYRLVEEVFEKVNTTFNEWNPDSEISKFNSMSAKYAMPLSEELEDLLKKVDEMVVLTEGRFDPSVSPLVQLWHQTLEVGKPPSDEEIAHLLPKIGWNNIIIADGQIRKQYDEVSISLSGFAKGHCVDMLVEALVEAGYPDIYVEWGGEIRTAGEHPDGRPWSVFVSNLGSANPREAVAIIAMESNALATSGDYLQQWIVAAENSKTGKEITYSHIIDPRTGYPIEVSSSMIASATVQAPTCASADALATAAMLHDSPEDARRWAQEIQDLLPGTAFWLIAR